MDEMILKALLKKATGYSYDEVTEEYGVDGNGEIVLMKRKVTNKYCPPDTSALKTYLEVSGGDSVSELTDDELEKEKARLLSLLGKNDKENKSSDKENEEEVR